MKGLKQQMGEDHTSSRVSGPHARAWQTLEKILRDRSTTELKKALDMAKEKNSKQAAEIVHLKRSIKSVGK